MSRPYGSYALRRVLHGLAMYLVMCLAYSAVFNGVADRALSARVEEETAKALRESGNLPPADFEALRGTTREALVRRYGLDRPLPLRIGLRALELARFDFGLSQTLLSSRGEREVLAIVLEALPNTLALFLSEAALVLAAGGALGLLAARRRGGLVDRLASVVPMGANGLPSWWVGMLALMLFSYALPLFPSGGIHANPAPAGFAGLLDYLHHMALPLLTLVALNLWNPAWLLRNLLGDAWDRPYIRAARARGLSEAALGLQVLAAIRPALATMVVLGLLQSLSGNILVEGIFDWPGLGGLYFAAVQQSDVPVLTGILSLQTAVNLAGLVGLDLAYGALDPRIRVGGAA